MKLAGWIFWECVQVTGYRKLYIKIYIFFLLEFHYDVVKKLA